MAFTDKTSAPVSELPKPELNPMMNPTLGRNLGRWAHAYFTSPPDKREEAVTELLRELESQTSETPLSAPSPHSASRIQEREQVIKQFFGTSESMFSDEAEPEHLFSQISDQPSPYRAELICPHCSYMNSREQKYCGHCGSPLSAHAQDIETRPSTHRHAPSQTPDDTQWLRERALSSFEQYDAPAGGGLKYLVLIFLILFAGFAYMRWVQSRPSVATVSKSASVSKRAAPRPDAVPPAAEPAGTRSDRSGDSTPGQVIKQDPAAAKTANPPVKQNPVPAALRSKETDTKSSDVSLAAAAAQGSYQDVLLAQQYLEGRTGSRNAPQAAQLLWRAVAKQNSDAAVLLSNLYAQGDGVPKSCDQARLLLVAAAKKGSAQAAQQLRTFYSHACR